MSLLVFSIVKAPAVYAVLAGGGLFFYCVVLLYCACTIPGRKKKQK